MITSMTLQNFKSWRLAGPVKLAPLTGLFGTNSSGKTSLMERLVAEITARGFRVSTVKHVHHDVDLDHPGKDTYRHRMAGAEEVVLASANRMALLREHRGAFTTSSATLSNG